VYLYDNGKKVLPSVDTPILKLAGLVTAGVLSMAGWQSGLSSLFNKDVKNIAACDLIMCRY
jgi:hypothetical protein